MDGARMPSSFPRRRMVSAAAPSFSRIDRAAATTSAARRDRAALSGVKDEDGMLGGDGEDVVVGRAGIDAIEEDAHLGLPPLQVGAQHVDLVPVVQLADEVGSAAAADEQVEAAFVGPDVVSLSRGWPGCRGTPASGTTRRLGRTRSPLSSARRR